MAGDNDVLRCSFCGKPRTDVVKLVAGPGVYICDECVDLCNRIIADQLDPRLGQPDADDETLLAQAVALHRSKEQVDRQVAAKVRALRARGVTWTRIGEALGITKQSAWERYSGED